MNDNDWKDWKDYIKNYLRSLPRKELDTLQDALLWIKEGGCLGEGKLKQFYEAVNEVDVETRG